MAEIFAESVMDSAVESPPQETRNNWLPLKIVAERFLGINLFTLYKWIDKGYGPPVYTFNRGRYQYKKEEVEEWINKRRLCGGDPLFQVICVAEAASIIGIHKNTLHLWMRDGRGPPKYIFNGQYVFRKAEVEQWVLENGRGTKAGIK